MTKRRTRTPVRPNQVSKGLLWVVPRLTIALMFSIFADDGSKVEVAKARPLSDSRKHTSLDAQKLFIARQRTMPVQIDASVIRVLPKHMRKRNKSAGMVRK